MATVNSVWGASLKRLDTEVPHDLEIPLLGTFPKELKAGIQQILCPPEVTAALFTDAKRRK